MACDIISFVTHQRVIENPFSKINTSISIDFSTMRYDHIFLAQRNFQ